MKIIPTFTLHKTDHKPIVAYRINRVFLFEHKVFGSRKCSKETFVKATEKFQGLRTIPKHELYSIKEKLAKISYIQTSA